MFYRSMPVTRHDALLQAVRELGRHAAHLAQAPRSAQQDGALQCIRAACLDALGDGFNIAGLQACVGREHAVGAVRLSVGLPTTTGDIDRTLDVLAGFAG